jgi:hypothetical protein
MEHGWSKEELESIDKSKRLSRSLENDPSYLKKEEKRIRDLQLKARRILNNGNVILVSGDRGYLSFEVKSLNNKDRYLLNRDRFNNWSGLYTYKDKLGRKLDVMRLVNNPDHSAYIQACEMWLKEYKEGDVNDLRTVRTDI